MPRPREFSIDSALERAMQVFWSRGYEAASLEELCEATGLGRSSLYAAFTDKRRLYIQALRHYQDRAVARVETALDGSAPLREQMARFLEQTIRGMSSGAGRRGCLIGNSAAAVPRDDPELAQVVREGIERHEQAFESAVRRAQAAGEIAPSASPAALARFIVASFHGLRLVGKARHDQAALNDVAALMLRCLDEPSSKEKTWTRK